MTKPHIGIILSSTREGRFGDKPGTWIKTIADARGEFSTEIVDLRDYDLPFFDQPMGPAYGPSSNPVALAWQAKLAELDGFIIVAAEYNHAPTGVLKNALDFAAKEWVRKPVAFVGYGGVGGARAVEQLRMIAVELQMAPIKSAVHIGGADFIGVWMQGKTFDDLPHLVPSAEALIADLAWWTNTLKTAREAGAARLAA